MPIKAKLIFCVIGIGMMIVVAAMPSSFSHDGGAFILGKDSLFYKMLFDDSGRLRRYAKACVMVWIAFGTAVTALLL